MIMKLKINFYKIVFSSYLFFCNNSIAQTFNYPQTLKQPVADTIFGKVVIDNYRWIEDLNSHQVKDWLKAQAAYTNNQLDKIPGRDLLLEEYNNLDKLATADILRVYSESNRYFYRKVLAGENIGKLYYREGKNGKEILLFDPDSYSNGKSDFSFIPSKDGKKVAVCLSEGGLQIKTIRVLNVDTKKFYTEKIYPLLDWPEITWTTDNKGFIYSFLQTDDPLSNKLMQNICAMYHIVGTDRKNDKIILSRTNNPDMDIQSEEIVSVYYSEDRKYILALLWSGQDNSRMFYALASDLLNHQINWKPITRSDDRIKKVVIYDDKAYVLSGKDAAKNKIVAFPLKDPDLSKARVIIPEGEKTLVDISRSKDYLFIQKTDGINTSIDQYKFMTGKIEAVYLPVRGYSIIQEFDVKTNDCMIHVSSWSQPTIRYGYNPITKKSEISPFNNTVKYPGTDDLITEELEVKGYDGVMIPLSLFYNKNIKKDGKNIVYMTGYGAYGSSSEPYFKLMYLPLLNRGVIIAETHPRGGGEKGDDWHNAGFKITKPNTWKDFISCGEFLIDKGYTSPKHLIGEGTSAGGILIGRAITERPDLFAAAVSNVSVSNTVRAENRPIGAADSKEFGTIKDSLEAMALIEMDAYLHVKKGVKYPGVICVGGMNDMYVPYWQPAKFAAALQDASASNKPVLFLVNYDSGHWSNEKKVTYRNYANIYSFALWQAGDKDFQPKQNKP